MFAVYRDQSAMTLLRKSWEDADASLRQQILRSLQRVDQVLSRNPRQRGESRPSGARILFVAPVAVLFTVDEERKLVQVVRAWTWRNRSSGQDQAA